MALPARQALMARQARPETMDQQGQQGLLERVAAQRVLRDHPVLTVVMVPQVPPGQMGLVRQGL